MVGLASARVVTHILTRDPAASKAWYTEILGLTVAEEDDYGCALRLNGATLRITRIEDHQAGPTPVLGWQVDDIAATIRTLNAKGVTMTIYEGYGMDALGVWTAPDGGSKLAWFADPDGNVLGLSQD